ncbi:hypothetical protein Tco_0697750 [Tanacetum coccineum]
MLHGNTVGVTSPVPEMFQKRETPGNAGKRLGNVPGQVETFLQVGNFSMMTLADKAILSGADNRPPMLEKDMYDSWKSIMELYMMNIQHVRMILESVEQGPLLWPTIEENCVTRPRKYSELTPADAIQADCDVKATNIILQGLPLEIYALVSNHRIAKDLSKRIKLLMQGTSLTKQERECKLYDEFNKFAYKKGETLFHHNVYSLLPSIPQLEYAPTVNQQQQQSEFPQLDSGLIVLVFKQGDDPNDAINHMMSFLSAVITSRFPTTNNQLRNSCKGEGHMSKQCTKPKRKRDDSWFKDKVLLVQAQANGQILHEEELAFLADLGTVEGQAIQTVITHNASYQADDLDAYDSDYDQNCSHGEFISLWQLFRILTHLHNKTEISVSEQQKKTQVINCQINLDNKSVNNTLTAELERYKEQVKVLKEGQNVDVKSKNKVVDSHEHEQNAEIDRLKQTLSEQIKEKESLMKTVTVLKNDFKKEESRNIDREIALENKIKHLDNIKAQQLEPKLYDGNVIKNTYAIVIPDSEETLMLAKESHFEKRFVPQTELSAEQAFWPQNSMNSSDHSPSCRPTKVEVPKELPKVSMVNTSLKKLKHHLAGFDVVVKERTTATAITEGSWEFKHTKACFRNEIIPFVKALKDAVKQHSLESKMFEVKMNQVLNENERLLEQVINKDIVNIIVNSSMNNAYVNVHECKKCLKLETELLNR